MRKSTESAWPRLQDVLAAHPPNRSSYGQLAACEGCNWSSEAGDWWVTHAAHQAEVWRAACTISTADQLDALPEHSVVRDADGDLMTKGFGDGTWFAMGIDERFYTGDVAAPALLVWHPDWSVQ